MNKQSKNPQALGLKSCSDSNDMDKQNYIFVLFSIWKDHFLKR